MMNKTTVVFFLFTVVFLFIVIAFEGCQTKTERLTKENTIIFALSGDISILNPILSSDSASSAVEGFIFSGLTKINENLEIVPDIAKSWEIKNGGKEYIFYLRDDVYWHDGEKLTSYDVKFTFDSILNPKVNSVRRGDYIIDGVPIKFETDGPYIFKVILPKPFAPILSRMGIGILPKHLLFDKDLNTAEFNTKPIGCGPFMFKEWIKSERVVLEKNPKYFDGPPKISGIIYKIIPDENARFVALESGQVDVSDIPPKDFNRAKKLKNCNVFEYDSLVYVYLGFNLKNEIFSDIRVRQALAYATDKTQLLNLIFRGLAKPAFGPMSPVSSMFESDTEKYNFDLKKANAILDEAGWILGSDGIREKNGKKLEFTILVNQGNKEREKAAVILQWQYKKIGAKVNIRLMEWSSLVKKLNSARKDFDSVIIGWSLGIDPDSYSIWHSSQYPYGLNFIGFSDPTVDRLLEEGRTTIDFNQRKRIYSQIQKIIAYQQPYIFLWYPKSLVAVSKKIHGLSKPGPAGLFVNIENVYISKDKQGD